MGNKNGTPVLRQEDIDILTNTSGMDEAQVRFFCGIILEICIFKGQRVF